MNNAQFGMIGLGVMGRNFLLNVAEHGFSCVGFDLDAEKVAALNKEGAEYNVEGVNSLSDFIAALEMPRKIMLLVPAGGIVDAVIKDLLPHLAKGDLVIDGGNSHFSDTERREKDLTDKGYEFLGVGVSGGEEGARHGASIMIGGSPDSYKKVQSILEAVSAKVNDEPCAAHVGKSSAGHFVKMVHNGIEYGLMQLISESYDLLKNGFGLGNVEIADHFGEWNSAELNSFLMEITETVLRKKDAETGGFLTDYILDTAGQKGTGKWTSVAAMDFGVPIPTIDSAVTMRQISAMKSLRVATSEKLQIGGGKALDQAARDNAVKSLRNGLYLAFIITYAQGLALLKAASEEKHYDLDFVEIAKIWRGGCIIRAALLEEIRKAFSAKPNLENLILAENFKGVIENNQNASKQTVANFTALDIPALAFSSTLNYLKSFTSARLPANILQAQRDFFGAHTYQRIDKEGTFHTPDWDSE
jgi:6-phosphogluconate dehydrogenase